MTTNTDLEGYFDDSSEDRHFGELYRTEDFNLFWEQFLYVAEKAGIKAGARKKQYVNVIVT